MAEIKSLHKQREKGGELPHPFGWGIIAIFKMNEDKLKYQKQIEEIKYKTNFEVCVDSCPTGFWDSYDERDQECVDKCIREILRCN